MRLCRVRRTVVATIHHPAYDGLRLMLCQPIVPGTERAVGPPVIAVDRVQAGVGDKVLVLTEGNGVRQLLGPDAGPIRSLIVGIVDQVHSC